jgi:DNA replicative helicase MCM subunit Mcm2 (Cdc46/Mcm family)
MQRNPSKRKDPPPVLKKVTRQCTKCHKEFETEVDSLGIPYSTRCDTCKEAEKTLTKYYEKLGGIRQ